ncbi:MAG TPA: ABC transporter substrate-binding protein [Candidatus Tectomicrobia bacterium]|nr:ABC transporter substrate-binding protein [Candidatus Tectomicrobia bacterium]
MAEGFLRLERCTEVQYVEFELSQLTTAIYRPIAFGAIDVSMAFTPPFIKQVAAGAPVVILGGVRVGCFKLFGTERVRAIRDLKGKTVSVPEQGGVHHLFVASMAKYVGLDPREDINEVIHPRAESTQPLAGEKVDALIGFPRSDYALQTMQEIPYNRWREYDPEDTVRFYALRLHEIGIIKGTPQKIIAQGTDWRFFNELEKELRGCGEDGTMACRTGV